MQNKQSFSLSLLIVVSVLMSGCGSNPSSALSVSEPAQTEASAWQACDVSVSMGPCLLFFLQFPRSAYRALALKKIQKYQQAEAERMQAEAERKEIEAKSRLEAKFERDKQLPVDVRRDKYMLALTTHLKNERYREAMQYFEWLERLGTKLASSFNYFYGEALLKTGDPEGAITKLYAYITEIGSKGKFYKRALELVNEAESIDIESVQNKTYGKTGPGNCPQTILPLTKSEPVTQQMPSTSIAIQILACTYGDNSQHVLQIMHPTGDAQAICSNSGTNPKLIPNYIFQAVTMFPSQELDVFGFGYQEVGGQAGVVVAQLMPGSPAQKGGLILGDLIIAINGDADAAENQANATEAFAGLNNMSLTVKRRNETISLHLAKFKFFPPQVIMIQSQNALGQISLQLPYKSNDPSQYQEWIDIGKAVLEATEDTWIKCN